VTSPNESAAPRLRPTHCLKCGNPITTRSSYTFFCSKNCAADWGDDEAMMQTLAAARQAKKEKVHS
jgi:endogenous inhibitor of DNA gyrase (YacG/DUF329 family)